MKRLLVLLAACSTPPREKLPSFSIAPQLKARTTSAACGTDVSFGGTGRTDIAYRYTYDDFGRLAAARGRWADGREDTIEYEYDNLDHMVQYVQTRDGMRVEIAAQYSTLGDLLEYTHVESALRYRDERRYAYSAFTEGGQPTRQQVTIQDQATRYRLDYDANGRIAQISPEAGGAPTIYTYDEDARTITIDTDGGAYRGVAGYDEANHQLFESWDGTDASVIATDERLEWAGDRLMTIQFRSGSELAPHALSLVEVHTNRYSCPQ